MSKCEKCKSKDWIKACTVNEQGYHHSFNDEPSLVFESGSKFWHKNRKAHRDNNLPARIFASGEQWWQKDGSFHRTNGPARIWPEKNIIDWFYEGKRIINGIKLTETTFQFEDQVGLILEHIEDKIYLGLLGDEKIMIGLKMAKCENCKNKDFILSCTLNEQGEHHSFNDEPSVVFNCGAKHWHKNGLVHRENDLPATIHPDGDKYWYKNGKYHRTNGPAAKDWINKNIISWFYEGQYIENGTKLSENTFQYKEQVGLILENIEDKIYLGLLGDEKIMIGLEDEFKKNDEVEKNLKISLTNPEQSSIY